MRRRFRAWSHVEAPAVAPAFRDQLVAGPPALRSLPHACAGEAGSAGVCRSAGPVSRRYSSTLTITAINYASIVPVQA
jgi:hypothetical protein